MTGGYYILDKRVCNVILKSLIDQSIVNEHIAGSFDLFKSYLDNFKPIIAFVYHGDAIDITKTALQATTLVFDVTNAIYHMQFVLGILEIEIKVDNSDNVECIVTNPQVT